MKLSKYHGYQELFNSNEHAQLGNSVHLPGVNSTLFLTKSGVRLTSGQIVAAADYYGGDPREPICLGGSLAVDRQRFLKAFASLDNANKTELQDILAIIQRQQDPGINSTARDTLALFFDTNGRYLELAITNLDHFNAQALLAYKVGHQLAIEQATQASQASVDKRNDMLGQAYALELYACHFLSDHFAAGHLRTPRQELFNYFKNCPIGQDIAALLSLLQHNEDGRYGLFVTNNNNELWQAFGDGYLDEAKSADNKARAIMTLQAGISDVYQGFTGDVANLASSDVFDMIPQVLATNFSPLFRVNDANPAQILYRAHLDDISCQTYDVLTLDSAVTILLHYAAKDVKAAIENKLSVNNDVHNTIIAINTFYQKSQVQQARICSLVAKFTLFGCGKPSDEVVAEDNSCPLICNIL